MRRIPLTPDLLPRLASRSADNGKEEAPSPDALMAQIAEHTEMITSTFVIEKGLAARLFTVTTTPVQIIDGAFARGYILINPTAPAGLTSSGTLIAAGTVLTGGSTGNTEASPVGVASYRTADLFLDVTANAAASTVAIDVLTQDPLSLNWATAQADVFGSPTAVGTYYANLGTIGVDKSFAIKYTIGAAGNVTASLSYLLKDGLPGGSSGVANTIFLGGGPNVNQNSGYPLIEGQRLSLYLKSRAELWAVSLISGGITLAVFDLQ